MDILIPPLFPDRTTKNSLQSTLSNVFESYRRNCFKANSDKRHFLLSSFSNKEMTIENCNIVSNNPEELLGMIMRSHLQDILKTSVGRLLKTSY